MPCFFHKPVLEHEVVAVLQPRSGGFYVDGTVGGGGHAAAVLRAGAPAARLFGIDRDAEAVAAARVRLAEFGDRVELRVGNFADVADWVPEGSADGVLLDLGVSSYQLDSAERGFSFQLDGPLDMRFDRSQGLTACDLVNELDARELERLFRELGGERRARLIARGIVRARRHKRIERTTELAELIERLVPRRGASTHPATRVFQALRMRVNDEEGVLRRGLASAWRVLRSGGRLAVICFHSGEERVVREFGRALVRDYEVEGDVDVPELRRPRAPLAVWVTGKAIAPSEAEVAENARARSARLRVLEKL
ncbi:MAG TPA: 16S rRNA (cytosine(1402)-N(4))-methyltransferase RsmH [Verrucomicrobiota bacterium]|nr:16S rRNA (cytosine(1402)-N(4))-methyltransferase RsmH [Verrucomicrobiota bacterium]